MTVFCALGLFGNIPPFPYYIGDRGDGYVVKEALLDPDSLCIVHPQLFFQCTVRPLQARANCYGRCPDDIHTNISSAAYLVFGVSCSAAVMHARSVQKMLGSNLVCTIFELRSDDQDWYVLA